MKCRWSVSVSCLVSAIVLSSSASGQEQAAGANASPGPVVTAVTPGKSPIPQAESGIIAEVRKMSQAGTDAEVIKAFIQNWPSGFVLTADDILALHEVGVSSDVLTALIRRSSAPQAPRVAGNAPGDNSANLVTTNAPAGPLSPGSANGDMADTNPPPAVLYPYPTPSYAYPAYTYSYLYPYSYGISGYWGSPLYRPWLGFGFRYPSYYYSPRHYYWGRSYNPGLSHWPGHSYSWDHRGGGGGIRSPGWGGRSSGGGRGFGGGGRGFGGHGHR